jgi:hypothetical protein
VLQHLDDCTLEVEMSREHTINGLFEALSRNGIEVISLRNKQNRLERLFLDMVDRRAGPVREPSPIRRSSRRPSPGARRSRERHGVGWYRYWISFHTIFVKEILRFTRIWVQTILPSVITTTLYFVIFGRLIGDRIGTMGGLDYLDFIVPGLVLMGVITNAYSNVVSSFYSSKFSRYIEELLVSPAPNWVILAGYVPAGSREGWSSGWRSCWSPRPSPRSGSTAWR